MNIAVQPVIEASDWSTWRSGSSKSRRTLDNDMEKGGADAAEADAVVLERGWN